MNFKGKKVDWVVSGDDIIHIDISDKNADVCILTELTTEYKMKTEQEKIKESLNKSAELWNSTLEI